MKKILNLFIVICSLFCLVSCKNNSGEVVKIIDIKLTDEEYAYAVKKGNTSLQEDFNLFLADIKLNGKFGEIVAKYFEGVGTKQGYAITTDSVANTDDNFVVATNCPFEPFEYIGSDGLAYGIDIEIANEYAKSRNLDLVIKNIDFDAILNDVDAGYSDIGMAGMTITESRLDVCDFTSTYYQASQKIVVAYDNQDFNNCKNSFEVEKVLLGLNDEKIGYQIGTTGNWYVVGDEYWGFEGFSNLEAKGYKTAQLAIQDVINGVLYAVVVDEAPAEAIVKATNSLSTKKWATFIDSLKHETFQDLLLTGLRNTILIAILGLIIGILIGTIIAIIKVAPKNKWYMQLLDKISTFYIAIFRGTPMVVQLLIAYYVLVPTIGIKGVEPLNVAIIVFGLNSAAYVAEIMRGGLNSVDRGQFEAGRALGLSYPITMIKIIIPQAIKNILPTLGNEFITLIKETSIVSFVTVVDLYTAFNTIGLKNYSVVVPYIVMAVIYILLVVMITLIVKLLERGLGKGDRRN